MAPLAVGPFTAEQISHGRGIVATPSGGEIQLPLVGDRASRLRAMTRLGVGGPPSQPSTIPMAGLRPPVVPTAGLVPPQQPRGHANFYVNLAKVLHELQAATGPTSGEPGGGMSAR